MGQTGYGQEGALSPLPGHRARDSEPGAFCSLSVHPSWMSGRGTWHGDCSLTGVRGIHWPSFPQMPGPRGREERNGAGKGQRGRQQHRGYLPTAAVEQVVHCSRAVGRGSRWEAGVQSILHWPRRVPWLGPHLPRGKDTLSNSHKGAAWARGTSQKSAPDGEGLGQAETPI